MSCRIFFTSMQSVKFFSLQDIFGNPGYIASQGPVKVTINDFWRMLWQYEVKVVAMACRLVEMGRVTFLFLLF